MDDLQLDEWDELKLRDKKISLAYVHLLVIQSNKHENF